MLTLFIILAALSFAATIGGAIWWVVSSGQMRTRSGPAVGAEIMGGLGEEEPEDGQVEVYSASKQVFKGTGVKIEGAAETSFGDLKRQLASGERRAALPPMIAAIGLLATVVFAALALFAGLEDKLIGGAFADIFDRIALFRRPGQAWNRARGLPRSAWGAAVAHAGLGVTFAGMAGMGLATDTLVTLRPGQSYQVADNEEPHRSRTESGATLFIVDRAPCGVPT